MKIKIKLANGIEINKDLSAEQIQKAENNKAFKKIERNNKKTFESYCKSGNYVFRCFDEDKKRAERLNDLQFYVNYLQTL